MPNTTSAPGRPLARRSTVEPMVALPVACGELFQGTLEGIPCLVSCPIKRYTYAKVEIISSPRLLQASHRPWSVPKDTPKAAAALFEGRSWFGDAARVGRLRMISRTPRARGYASTTADVGATRFALAEALVDALSPAEAARLVTDDRGAFRLLVDGLRGRDWQAVGAARDSRAIAIDTGTCRRRRGKGR